MKKLIPPFLFVLCVGLIATTKFLIPDPLVIPAPYNLLGIAVILFGYLLLSRSRKLIDKYDTEIHTFKQPRNMISEGPFRYSRNPIYAAFTLMIIGLWMVLGNWYGAVSWIIFFLCANFWYIPFEEKILEKEFGHHI